MAVGEAVAVGPGVAVSSGSGSGPFGNGCQSGALLPTAVVVVTRCWSIPAAAIVKISKSPSWLVANAIRSPSGENAGVALAARRVAVRFTTPVPSAAIVWICWSRVNAICVPSGDHDGSWLLSAGRDRERVLVVAGRGHRPDLDAPQSRAVSNAIVDPSGRPGRVGVVGRRRS